MPAALQIARLTSARACAQVGSFAELRNEVKRALQAQGDAAAPQGHSGIELKGLPLLNAITKARPDSSGRLRARCPLLTAATRRASVRAS